MAANGGNGVSEQSLLSTATLAISSSTSTTRSSTTTIATTATTTTTTTSSPASSPTLNSVTTSSTYTFFSTGSVSTSGTTSPGGTAKPNPSPQPNQPTDQGLSTGATAGIAIGTAIIGIVIGLLIGILIMARRRRSRMNSKSQTSAPGTFYAGNGPNDGSYESKQATVTATPAPVNAQGSPDINLAAFLATAKPDRELAGELTDLGTLIQQHVETYYHIAPVNPNAQEGLLRALHELNISAFTGVDDGRVVAMALDPRSRSIALRHVISATIFRGFLFGWDANGAGQVSLLPAPIAEFAQKMPPLERYSGNSGAMNQALTRWRQLSVYLLNRHRSERGALKPADFGSEITAQAGQLAATLRPFLSIFVEQNQGQAQDAHLQRVVVECAKLGYAVFSQPDELRFSYALAGNNAGGGGGGGVAGQIAAHPGLLQVADERGSAMKNARVILPPSLGHD